MSSGGSDNYGTADADKPYYREANVRRSVASRLEVKLEGCDVTAGTRLNVSGAVTLAFALPIAGMSRVG